MITKHEWEAEYISVRKYTTPFNISKETVKSFEHMIRREMLICPIVSHLFVAPLIFLGPAFLLSRLVARVPCSHATCRRGWRVSELACLSF
jgi:hypothetical protein